MKKVILKLISILAIITSIATSQINAGEVFSYKFQQNDSLAYKIFINSKLTFPELGNLAQLVNLDKLTHDVELTASLVVNSFRPNKQAVIRVAFGRISAVTIAGDSAFIDDRSEWGRIRSGSEYMVLISEQGEIDYLSRSDSLETRQVIQTMQRFFPIFPEKSINIYHSWPDSVSFELEMPGQKAEDIQSLINYTYYGKKDSLELGQFGYKVAGQSRDSESIKLSGSGNIVFDKERGQLLANDGNIIIDAEVSLAAFGLPPALGTTAVHIDSKVRLELVGDE